MQKLDQQWKAWILAARPKTLTAALAPVLVGTALSWAEKQTVSWWVVVLTLLASLFIQVGTNLVNDAVDFSKGADTDKRIGPQRVTQSGLFSGQQVMRMAGLMFTFSIFCGLPLIIHGGWAIGIIGVVSVLMGYSYTGGPFPLAYKGLGDIFVILFFGIIAVSGVDYLHTGLWTFSALVAGLQVGFHCAVLIAINNLRDMDQDKLVLKKTLPVRFGKLFARWEIAALCAAPFFVGIYWISMGKVVAFLIPLVLTPLAFQIAKLVFETEPSPAYNHFLGKAALLHAMFAILLTMSLVI